MGNSKKRKREIHLRNMNNRCFNHWLKGRVTPFDEEILKEWEHKVELKARAKKIKSIAKKLGNTKRMIFINWCFHKWQKGQVTPIDDKSRDKFECMQFRQLILKYNGLNLNSEYSVHHLLPKGIFPSLKFDVNNVILLHHSVHEPIHDKYSNLKLAIDPITPVIESLETAFMEAK